MPRKAKGIHTCPENAGEKNMTPENMKGIRVKPTGDEAEFLGKTIPILERAMHMKKVRESYGGKWTEEELATSIKEFFEYCETNDLEPSPPMLKLWLAISDDTDWEWRKKDHGFKSEIYRWAYRLMEMRYFGKLDKYAVSNIFKLKTVHGYVEPQRVEIATTKEVSEADIGEAVSKLGLDK